MWHMACHVSSCMTLLNPINRGFQFSLWESSISVRGGSSKEKEEEGKREREERKRERVERKVEREENKKKERRKEKKKGEDERKKRKSKECCTVSRPGRQKTQNCATRGRFPPTLVILRLGAT